CHPDQVSSTYGHHNSVGHPGEDQNYNVYERIERVTMIRIAPQHIYALRDSTGKPFTDLLDRLIRSSAAILGIQPQKCSTTLASITPTVAWTHRSIRVRSRAHGTTSRARQHGST